MTDQELNTKMAELLGYQWFSIPFNDEQKVLAFSEEQAKGVYLGGDIYQFVPDFCNDFNLIYQAEVIHGLRDRSNPGLRVKWQNSIHKVMAAAVDCPKNKMGSALVSDIDCLLMTARQRVEAFVLTFSETKVK